MCQAKNMNPERAQLMLANVKMSKQLLEYMQHLAESQLKIESVYLERIWVTFGTQSILTNLIHLLIKQGMKQKGCHDNGGVNIICLYDFYHPPSKNSYNSIHCLH